MFLVLGGCIHNDPRGYVVWVTNESDSTFRIEFRGETPVDGDSRGVAYRVEPERTDAQGPFVDLQRAADGRSFLPGRVSVFTEDCVEVASFEVTPGDYELTIDRDGRPQFAEIGFGQRPGNQDFLVQSTHCSDGGGRAPLLA